MDMESREKFKKRGFKRLFCSFKYTIDGLKYAYKYEQNFMVHFIITVLVIIFGIYFKIEMYEWLTIMILLGLVLAAELINTAFEATLDFISPTVHPLAKIAKDTAAAAVLVLASISFVSGLIIFIPKIVEFLR